MELTWYRADTAFASHDKVLALVETFGNRGKQAGFVYQCALGHAVGHGTDGLIKRTSLRWVHGTTGDADLLVSAGLWEACTEGWRITNFGTRQVVGAALNKLSASPDRPLDVRAVKQNVTIQLRSTATKQNGKQLSSVVLARTYERTNATDVHLQALTKTPQEPYAPDTVDNPELHNWISELEARIRQARGWDFTIEAAIHPAPE